MKVHEPERVHAAFAEAYNAGNLEDLVALSEADAVLSPQPGQRVAGSSAIRESLMGFLNLKGRMEIDTLSCLRSGDLALLQAKWRISAIGPDGKPFELSSRTAEVVRQQPDGFWVYVIDNAFAEA